MEISCSICYEEYITNNDISATRCGHVFHTRCIQDWLGRSATCQECHQSCNETFKIFLKCNNSPEDIEANKLLKSQLDQSLKNASEIQNLLDQSEQSVLDLQEQVQVTQSELDLLQDQNEYLKIQTEARSKEIAIKTNEIIKLREGLQQMSLDGRQPQSYKVYEELALKNSTIKSLEEQLRNKSLDLEKEIRNSTMLINDKIKLQKLLDSYNAGNKQNRIQHHDNNKKPASYDKTNTKSQQNSAQQIEKPPFVPKTTQNPLNKSIENIEKNAVRISGFQNINSPLEDVVLHLAKLMEIECKCEDIENVYFLPPQKNFRNNLQTEMNLLVNFKTSQLKTNFLTNKAKLNVDRATKNLRITDVNPSTTKHELHMYTQKLRAVGFQFFCIKNGNVLVKENNFSPFIKIHNKEQVDNMLRANVVHASAENVFDCAAPFSTI